MGSCFVAATPAPVEQATVHPGLIHLIRGHVPVAATAAAAVTQTWTETKWRPALLLVEFLAPCSQLVPGRRQQD